MTLEIKCKCGHSNCLQMIRISAIEQGARYELWHKSAYGEESTMYLDAEDIEQIRKYLHENTKVYDKKKG